MTSELTHRIKKAGRILLRGTTDTSKKRDVPHITSEEIDDVKNFFPLLKFFVFGHARSGTTLLTRLLRVHPNVHCNYQAHFFTRAPLLESLVEEERIELWLARRSNRWNQGRDLSPLVLRAVSDFIMERDARKVGKAGPGCIVGDKSPNSLMNGQAVHQMIKVYPDARLVFIVRDGRDAILSHRFQTFIDNPHRLSKADLRIRKDFSKNPDPYLTGQKSLFTEKGIQQSTKGWVENVTETDRAAKKLLKDNYYPLRYEDLLENPQREMKKLWIFLGVDPQIPVVAAALDSEFSKNPDADWQAQKAGDIASAIGKGKAGSWQELFTLRDKQIFSELAGDILHRWGYEDGTE